MCAEMGVIFCVVSEGMKLPRKSSDTLYSSTRCIRIRITILGSCCMHKSVHSVCCGLWELTAQQQLTVTLLSAIELRL